MKVLYLACNTVSFTCTFGSDVGAELRAGLNSQTQA